MFNIVSVLLRRLQMPLIVLILAYAVGVLGFVLIPGVDDHGQPWRMSFFHAFYVVTYTASTIGFGELPFLFTDAQRLWATVTIYFSVFAWMYAIGVMLAVLQDNAFRALVRELTFRRAVRRIVEPFYLVSGYGDTGGLVVRALADAGIRSVVLDVSPERIDALSLEDMRLPVPGWCADAGKPDNLIAAGLKSRHCAGVLALTNVDVANQQIAAATKLLRPEMTVIARAESRDAAISIAAYGTDHILDPYELFARIVKHALHAPSMYLLDERLTSVPDEPWTPPLHPPRGHWIVCGYGRVGQAIHGVLSGEGITCAIVEADPQLAARWPGAVLGTGIAADTLRQAGARDAQALIACTDNDANNLAVVFAARELNPDLFIVLRQNQRDNDAIVRAARVPLVLQRGSVLAGEVFSLVTSPLIVDFLRLAEQEDERWAEDLWRRIRAITGERNPDRWVVHVRSKDAPAISLAIAGGWSVRIRDLQRDPSNRDDAIPSVPLLLKRGRDFILLPAPDEALHKGDAVLFCGERAARRRMEWVTRNHNVFHYIYTGEERANRLLEKLALRKARAR